MTVLDVFKDTEGARELRNALCRVYQEEDAETFAKLSQSHDSHISSHDIADGDHVLTLTNSDGELTDIILIFIVQHHAAVKVTKDYFDNVPVAVLTVSDDAKLIYVNPLLHEWLNSEFESIKYRMAMAIIGHELGHIVMGHQGTSNKTEISPVINGHSNASELVDITLTTDVDGQYLQQETEADRVAMGFTSFVDVVLMRSYLMTHSIETGGRLYNASAVTRHMEHLDDPSWPILSEFTYGIYTREDLDAAINAAEE